MIKRESTQSLGNISDESQEITFTELLYTHNQIIPPRNFSIDPAQCVELINVFERAIIFPNMASYTLEEMVEDMLIATLERTEKREYFKAYQQYDIYEKPKVNKNNQASVEPEYDLGVSAIEPDDKEEDLKDTRVEFTVELAMNSIFVSETVSNLTQSIQRTMFNDYDGIFYDDSWLIILCELQSIKSRKLVIARMAYKMYIMPTCTSARCVILVLANSAEKGRKGVIQTGCDIGTILSLPEFLDDFNNAENSQEILNLFRSKLTELKTETNIESVALAGAAVAKKKFIKMYPFQGITQDIRRRLPYYLNDFSDGLTGFTTKQKLFSAVVFQYFATVLPIIALGHNAAYATNNMLSTKTILYSQFFGSVFYGIFSGNPMMIFQVSSIILLYSKLLYFFSTQLNADFTVMFGLTGFFSGVFLVLVAIFNITNLMVYSTSSVADMVDVFQSITFCQSVGSNIIGAYNKNYNCEVKDEGCSPETFVLYIFVVFLTVVLANAFRSIRTSRIFNTAIREFLADMGISFGVILSSVVASAMFSNVAQTPFSYNSHAETFNFVHFGSSETMTVTICFLLAIPLALVIFIDHNLNGEFLSDPRNKLYKGRTEHFDMLVIGIINAVLSLFGMCSLQGIFPNTPLHIKQMGDVEVTSDQGVVVKTLIRVRDTRLTQLIVGILVGASTFLLPLPISFIPRAALDGLLVVISFISLEGNGLMERLWLFMTDASAFPSNHPIRRVPRIVCHKLSILQIIQLIVISYISFSNFTFLALLFPILLALMIPIRLYVVKLFFKEKHLEILDPTKI